jgi:hypothetical protein
MDNFQYCDNYTIVRNLSMLLTSFPFVVSCLCCSALRSKGVMKYRTSVGSHAKNIRFVVCTRNNNFDLM